MASQTTLAELARDRTRCDAWSTNSLLTLVIVVFSAPLLPPLLWVLLVAAPTMLIVMFTTRAALTGIAAARARTPLGNALAASTARSCTALVLLTGGLHTIVASPTRTGWASVVIAALVSGALLAYDLLAPLPRAVREQGKIRTPIPSRPAPERTNP